MFGGGLRPGGIRSFFLTADEQDDYESKCEGVFHFFL
jgi:hypothetical protein